MNSDSNVNAGSSPPTFKADNLENDIDRTDAEAQSHPSGETLDQQAPSDAPESPNSFEAFRRAVYQLIAQGKAKREAERKSD